MKWPDLSGVRQESRTQSNASTVNAVVDGVCHVVMNLSILCDRSIGENGQDLVQPQKLTLIRLPCEFNGLHRPGWPHRVVFGRIEVLKGRVRECEQPG